MAALVLAVSYFAAAWLGHNVKTEILVEHLTRMSRQICQTPDFHYYALAAGLKMAFMRHGFAHSNRFSLRSHWLVFGSASSMPMCVV